jgi:hypothetical protein
MWWSGDHQFQENEHSSNAKMGMEVVPMRESNKGADFASQILLSG